MFDRVMSRLPTAKEFNMKLVESVISRPAPAPIPVVHAAVTELCVKLRTTTDKRKRCVVCQSDITSARRLAILRRRGRGRRGRTGCGTAEQAPKCLYYCDKHEGGPVGLCAVARSPRTRTCWDVFHEDPEQFVASRRCRGPVAGSPPACFASPVSSASAVRTPRSTGASTSAAAARRSALHAHPQPAPPQAAPPVHVGHMTVNMIGGASGAAAAGAGTPAVPGLVPMALLSALGISRVGHREQV